MAELSDRVRTALADRAPREVKMFGGLAFMVDDAMVVCVQGNGELLVRADPSRSDELLARGGARPAEMGAGRRMGPSWISVDASALRTDEGLAFWLGVALEYNASQGRR